MLKNGQRIVVKINGEFRRGYFKENIDSLAIVRFSPDGPFESVLLENVYALEETTDEVVHEWAVDQHKQIEQLVGDYFEKCRPDYEYELTFEGSQVDLDGVSLIATEIFVPCIGKVREFPCWELTDFKYHPSTREEPEDMTIIPVSKHRNTLDAVCALIKYVMARDIDGYFEAIGECQMFEDQP